MHSDQMVTRRYRLRDSFDVLQALACSIDSKHQGQGDANGICGVCTSPPVPVAMTSLYVGRPTQHRMGAPILRVVTMHLQVLCGVCTSPPVPVAMTSLYVGHPTQHRMGAPILHVVTMHLQVLCVYGNNELSSL